MDTREVNSIDTAFYRLASDCFNIRLDVVFKGGCLLRHILREANQTKLRSTKDIDFDISKEVYLLMYQNLKGSLKLGRLRSMSDSMGYMCNVKLLDRRINCDVYIRNMIDSNVIRLYEGLYGKFYGVKIEDILADKIQSMSGNHTVGRAKDIVDVYRIITVLSDKLDFFMNCTG